MANSKYEYVRQFEQADRLPLANWIVVRVDGRGFHRFSNKHNFAKPNDLRAINLMNKAAEGVLRDVQDILLAYGVSDEFSFLFHQNTQLYSRRASKLISTVVSTFTAHYIVQWPVFFPDSPLDTPTNPQLHPPSAADPALTSSNTNSTSDYSTREDLHPLPKDSGPPLTRVPTGPLPTFDARAICYPRHQHIRDYLSWRQADCHINNLYNMTFWALVQRGGLSNRDAEQALAGTLAAEKNEILWSRFGINYNDELPVFRKGSIILREGVNVARKEVGRGSGEGGGAREMGRDGEERIDERRGKIFGRHE
ncbi:MAG: hypothetical protein Q9159_003451 [Coniocarpon cinnabarinum]